MPVIFGRSFHRLTVLLAIPLLALSSLPQLVCSCDISWGPGGFFGSHRLCDGDAGAGTRKCGCCGRSHAQRKESLDSDKRSAEDCDCGFKIVRSPAMQGPGGMERLPCVDVAECFAAAEAAADDDACFSNSCLRPAPSLTPRERCALFQIWRT
jgi:hypothetical protein